MLVDSDDCEEEEIGVLILSFIPLYFGGAVKAVLQILSHKCLFIRKNYRSLLSWNLSCCAQHSFTFQVGLGDVYILCTLSFFVSSSFFSLPILGIFIDGELELGKFTKFSLDSVKRSGVGLKC